MSPAKRRAAGLPPGESCEGREARIERTVVEADRVNRRLMLAFELGILPSAGAAGAGAQARR